MVASEHDQATRSDEKRENASGPDPQKAGEHGDDGGEREARSPAQGGFRDAWSSSVETLSSLGSDMADEAKKPTTAAALAGGLVVGSAIAIGAAETAVGALAAYVVYRTMKGKQARRS